MSLGKPGHKPVVMRPAACRRDCCKLALYRALFGGRFLARFVFLCGFGVGHRTRCVRIFCSEPAFFCRRLRVQVTDDRLVFIANQRQDLGRGRAHLLHRWRGGAIELILREKESADHAGQRRRQDVEDEFAEKSRQKRRMDRIVARGQNLPTAVALHRQPPSPLKRAFFKRAIEFQTSV